MLVEPRVAGEFRMKSRSHQVVLLNCHRPTVRQGSKHLYLLADRDDNGRPDEDAVKRDWVEARDLKVFLEAVYLPAECVTLHPDIHQSQRHRVSFGNLVGHHYHPGASAPDGLTLAGHSFNGLS